MRRMIRSVIAPGLSVLLALALGCTQEEQLVEPKTETSTSQGAGEPDIESVYELLCEAQSLGRTLLDFTWDMTDTILATHPDDSCASRRRRRGGTTEMAADTLMLVYHESSGYWLCTAVYYESGAYSPTTLTVIDSLQFVNRSGASQWPATEPDELLTVNVGGRLLRMWPDNDSSVATHDLVIAGGILDGLEVTIDGLQTFVCDKYREDDSCGIFLDLTALLTDVVGPSVSTTEPACPTSGKAQYCGDVAVHCSGSLGTDFSDFWGINQEFLGDGAARYEVYNLSGWWTFVGSCL